MEIDFDRVRSEADTRLGCILLELKYDNKGTTRRISVNVKEVRCSTHDSFLVKFYLSKGSGKDYKDAKRKTTVSTTGIFNEQFVYDVPEKEADLANRVQITVWEERTFQRKFVGGTSFSLTDIINGVAGWFQLLPEGDARQRFLSVPMPPPRDRTGSGVSVKSQKKDKKGRDTFVPEDDAPGDFSARVTPRSSANPPDAPQASGVAAPSQLSLGTAGRDESSINLSKDVPLLAGAAAAVPPSVTASASVSGAASAQGSAASLSLSPPTVPAATGASISPPTGRAAIGAGRTETFELMRHGSGFGFTFVMTYAGQLLRTMTVTDIRAGGAAEQSGKMRPGDLITSLNGQAIGSMTKAEVETLLHSSPKVTIGLQPGAGLSLLNRKEELALMKEKHEARLSTAISAAASPAAAAAAAATTSPSTQTPAVATSTPLTAAAAAAVTIPSSARSLAPATTASLSPANASAAAAASATQTMGPAVDAPTGAAVPSPTSAGTAPTTASNQTLVANTTSPATAAEGPARAAVSASASSTSLPLPGITVRSTDSPVGGAGARGSVGWAAEVAAAMAEVGSVFSSSSGAAASPGAGAKDKDGRGSATSGRFTPTGDRPRIMLPGPPSVPPPTTPVAVPATLTAAPASSTVAPDTTSSIAAPSAPPLTSPKAAAPSLFVPPSPSTAASLSTIVPTPTAAAPSAAAPSAAATPTPPAINNDSGASAVASAPSASTAPPAPTPTTTSRFTVTRISSSSPLVTSVTSARTIAGPGPAQPATPHSAPLPASPAVDDAGEPEDSLDTSALDQLQRELQEESVKRARDQETLLVQVRRNLLDTKSQLDSLRRRHSAQGLEVVELRSTLEQAKALSSSQSLLVDETRAALLATQQQLVVDKAAIQQELESLAERARSAEAQRAQLEEKLAATTNQQSSLSRDLEQAKADLAAAVKELDESTREQATLTDRLLALTEEKQQWEAGRLAQEALTRDASKAALALAALQAEMETRTREWAEEKEALLATTAAVQKERDAAQAETATQQAQLALKQTEIENLQRNLQSAEAGLQALSTEAEEAQALRALNRDLEKSNSDLTARLSSDHVADEAASAAVLLEQAQQKWQAELDAANKELVTLRQEREAQSKQCAQLEEEVQSLRDQAQKLSKQMEQDKKSDAASREQERNTWSIALAKEREFREAQRVESANELAAKDAEHKLSRERFADIENQLRTQITLLDEEKTSLTMELHEIQAAHAVLEEKLASAMAAKLELQAVVKREETLTEELRAELTALEAKQATLTLELEQATKQASRVRGEEEDEIATETNALAAERAKFEEEKKKLEELIAQVQRDQRQAVADREQLTHDQRVLQEENQRLVEERAQVAALQLQLEEERTAREQQQTQPITIQSRSIARSYSSESDTVTERPDVFVSSSNDEVEALRATMAQQVGDLTKRVVDTEKALQAAERKLAQAQRELESINSEANALRAENERLEGVAGDAERAAARLRDQVATTEQELASKDDELLSLRSAAAARQASLEQRISILSAPTTPTSGGNGTRTIDTSAMQAQIAELQSELQRARAASTPKHPRAAWTGQASSDEEEDDEKAVDSDQEEPRGGLSVGGVSGIKGGLHSLISPTATSTPSRSILSQGNDSIDLGSILQERQGLREEHARLVAECESQLQIAGEMLDTERQQHRDALAAAQLEISELRAAREQEAAAWETERSQLRTAQHARRRSAGEESETRIQEAAAVNSSLRAELKQALASLQAAQSEAAKAAATLREQLQNVKNEQAETQSRLEVAREESALARQQASVALDKLADLMDENKGLRQYVDQLIGELMKMKKPQAVVRASMLGIDGSPGPLSPTSTPRRGGKG